jgi:hypothetical protein
MSESKGWFCYILVGTARRADRDDRMLRGFFVDRDEIKFD